MMKLCVIIAFLSISFCLAQELEEKPHLYLNQLQPNEMGHVAFHNGTRLTDYLYAIGFAPRLRETLYAFVEKNGILKAFQDMEKNPLDEGKSSTKAMQDGLWHVQRPDDRWHSNMHWIIPAEEKTQLQFLTALGDGGFDDSLDAIGKHLNMEGIVCYHFMFIAVTNCSQGYMHQDFHATNGKGFNLIIPLLLKEDSVPELDVWVDETEATIGLKYQYDMGFMLGDDAYHGTSAIDYTGTGKMRMMATVYLADINEDNVDAIMNAYTQEYPPASRSRLLAQRGEHWRKPNRLPRSVPVDDGQKSSMVCEEGDACEENDGLEKSEL